MGSVGADILTSVHVVKSNAPKFWNLGASSASFAGGHAASGNIDGSQGTSDAIFCRRAAPSPESTIRVAMPILSRNTRSWLMTRRAPS